MSFFDAVLDFFKLFGAFCESLWDGLTNLIAMIQASVGLPLALTGYTPAILSSCILAVVSLGVVKLIVGRQ